MTRVNLPADKMFPNILLVRFYETKKDSPQKRRDRISGSYELSYYLDSSGGAVIINGNNHQINCGDIRFTRPGTSLYSVPNYNCHTVYFEFGESGVHYSNQILDSIPEFFSTGGEYADAFAEMLKYYHSAELSAKVKLNALLLQTLARIYEQLHPAVRYSPVVSSCIDYINRHYAEDITLGTLGKLSGYSALHILRLFKRDTSRTPHDFLTSARIDKAKELLNHTDIPVYEIASLCGFNSDAHFKMLFKKETGFTPGNYRRI